MPVKVSLNKLPLFKEYLLKYVSTSTHKKKLKRVSEARERENLDC